MLDALAHAHGEGDRPPRRQAVERAARRVRRDRRPPARLRARPDGGVRHADRRSATSPARSPTSRPSASTASTATAAADVWAVGVMLWEALAGKHPFRSSNAAGTTRRIRAGAPPLETVRPDLPRAAPRRGRRGTPPGSRARGRSAAQLAAELRDGAPQAPARPGSGRGARRRARPPRELLVVAAARARRRRPSPRRSGPAGSPRRCRSTRRAGRSG